VLPLVVAGLLVIASVAALAATASRSDDVPHPAAPSSAGDQ